MLQRRNDEGVVGRVTQDAIDVASQARVVAHESREAYGDARPPWRDAACRQCHAPRASARSKLRRVQSGHLLQGGSNDGFPRQGKVGERSVERRCWRSRRGRTHLTLRRRTHGVRRSSGTPPARYNTSCIVLVVFSGSCPSAVGFPAPTVCSELGRYFRYFRQVASKRRERGRFVVTSVLAASF